MLALSGRSSPVIGLVLAAAAAGALASSCGEEERALFVQTNLVSDVPGRAAYTDARLVNPWGLAYGPQTPFWVANNGTGTSTVYNGDGRPQPAQNPLVVTIEALDGGTSAPTGIAFNDADAFEIFSDGAIGPSVFIFSNEEGTIAGWNPVVAARTALVAVDNGGVAVYKGLAIGSESGSPHLYATNFLAGTVDVFDRYFNPVDFGLDAFMDPDVPADYAPFGIANLEGTLYVTYAQQDADLEDDVPGEGHGFVSAFDARGRYLRRVASRGVLNSPWGLAIAPDGFGDLEGALLVGNFGDGRIHAYDRGTGALLGALLGGDGAPIEIEGLWAILPGNGGASGDRDKIYFTAGPDDEQHGLFGSLRAVER